MSQPIRKIEGVAAPLVRANVSTDAISPSAAFNNPGGNLGEALFAHWRKEPGFVLNQPRYQGARILVSGENFGCGSSREQAIWCLTQYGFRAVIAESFAEIFFENAFKNRLVAITLPAELIKMVVASVAMAQPTLAIDLETQKVSLPGGIALPFTMDEYRRTALLEGLEEIDMILREDGAIQAWQERERRERPWLG